MLTYEVACVMLLLFLPALDHFLFVVAGEKRNHNIFDNDLIRLRRHVYRFGLVLICNDRRDTRRPAPTPAIF